MENNLQDIFIPYEESLGLKQLGFDEECLGFYLFDKKLQLSCASFATNSYFKDSPFKEVSVPTWEQAFKFFRDKHGLASSVISKMSYGIQRNRYWINELKNRKIKSNFYENKISVNFDNYEEAKLECLKQLIKIVKDEK